MRKIILITNIILILISIKPVWGECRAGFDGTYAWEILPGMLPIPLLYRDFSDSFDYFRVDSPTSEISLDSVDIYFVPPRLDVWVPYSDSLADEFREFVYEGGILFMWGENCNTAGISGTFGIIYDSISGWFTGLEPAAVTVYDSVNNLGGGWSYFYYNILQNPFTGGGNTFSKDLKVVHGSLGSAVYVRPPAKALATTYPEGWSRSCADSSLDEICPTVLAMSHYGEGIIFFHCDFTNWRYHPSYGTGFPPNSNLELIFELADCSKIPNFQHFPERKDTIYCLDESLYVSTVIENYGKINWDSLSIWWEDSIYNHTSDKIKIIDDISFNFIIPAHSYHDGDTIRVCIHNIVDTTLFWEYDSACWVYYVDIDEEPPVLSNFNPSLGETTMSLPIISFVAKDPSGLDTSSIEFTFLDTTIGWGEPCIWLNGDTIFFDPGPAGLDPGEIDTTLQICISLQDYILDCSSNRRDTCWTFFNASYINERKDTKDLSISIYPNPFNAKCFITASKRMEVEIRDIRGRKINNISIPGVWNGKDYKGDRVEPGIYFIFNENFRSKILLID